MDKKYNNETQMILMNVLEGLKKDGERWEKYRVKQLWAEVRLPCSIYDAIRRLTKNDMSRVRQSYEFMGISALNKAALAEELAMRIPEKFKGLVRTLDQNSYDVIKAIVSNSGVIIDPGFSLSAAEAYLKHGIIYPGIYEGEKVLFMPTELVRIFAELDGPELENIIRRNTEWVLLAQGMLFFYGIMDVWPITKRIEELTGAKVDPLELIRVLSFSLSFYGQIQHTSYGYIDASLRDVALIISEQGKRPGVDYYPFTKQQLLRAGKPGYIHRTSALNSLIGFLTEHYDTSHEENKDFVRELTKMINTRSSLSDLLEYVHKHMEVPDKEFGFMFAREVQELYNNSRQWALKGHTPAELHEEERQVVSDLPAVRSKREKPKPPEKVTNPPARSAKVGRNDPCPCGSGHKYKKCCGK